MPFILKSNRLDRRRFLLLSGLLSAAGYAGISSGTQCPQAENKSDGGLEEILDACVFFGPYIKQPLDASPETVLRLLDRAHIGQALATSLVGLDYSFEEGNRHTLEVCRKHSARLLPCATVNPLTFVSGRHLGQQFKDEGFKAVAFFPRYEFQEWPFELMSFQRCVEEVAETGLPCIVNIASPGDASRLASVIGKIRSPIIIRAPASGGYSLPTEYLSVGESCPNFYFDVVNLVGVGNIELLVKRIGADRLIVGSNTPFFYTLSSLYLVQYADLSPGERRAIASGTIRRLLGLTTTGTKA